MDITNNSKGEDAISQYLIVERTPTGGARVLLAPEFRKKMSEAKNAQEDVPGLLARIARSCAQALRNKLFN